jgi:signal transduction histidine kinase
MFRTRPRIARGRFYIPNGAVHQTTVLLTVWYYGKVTVIADTGRGIPHEHLHRIFDPGFTTKGVGVGTGLGLSISYNIVEKHNGQIDVESQPEAGTVFTLHLPIRAPILAHS